MTTLEILNRAYADIFGIEQSNGGDYSGQKTGDSVIDYTSFKHYSMEYDIDSDSIEAVVADGSEECWINLYLRRAIQAEHRENRVNIGCIKTLDEGRAAWRNMGTLAGEISYMADYAAWKIRAEAQ